LSLKLLRLFHIKTLACFDFLSTPDLNPYLRLKAPKAMFSAKRRFHIISTLLASSLIVASG
jgi:hypothetical protein